ncbi:MAG: hypothetical protein GY913_24050 [Proteobacteria bacterium]|nr:hypothetical protein [Pseudomonadota bacterium]MCP4919987.1 hypothetical protein [Pseudomonadota bacterium]
MDADALLARLRTDDTHTRQLVTLVVDDLLDRPVEELVDPDWLAARLTEGFRASVEDDRTKEWIRARVQDLRARLDQESGPLLYKVDPALVEPVKDLLRRPYEPNPLVVRALLDHKATRSMFSAVLTHTVEEFAKTVKMPETASKVIKSTGIGRSRLAQWAGAAKAAAEIVGSEVEKRMEGRVQGYVDGAIGKAIEIAVEHACDPRNADAWAQQRADSVDVLLAFPVETWRDELDKLDLDQLIDDLAATLRAFAKSDAFEEQVKGVLELTVQEGEGKTARQFLDGSGLEDTWRESLEDLLNERVTAFVETDAFEGWLRDLTTE